MSTPLSRREIEQFFEVGFIVLPDLFSRAEVATIASAFDRLQAIGETLDQTATVDGSTFVLENGRVQRIVWCSGAVPELEHWSCDTRLLTPVFQLLAPQGQAAPDHVVQLICQAHLKLPGDEVSFPWHQDAQHRRYGTDLWQDMNGRGSYVQTVLAVDEMTPENGPLVFVPGSCRAGALTADDVLECGRQGPHHVLTAKPGSVALFGPYTVHGSEPNRGRTARRAWINGYAYPGANRRAYPGCGLGIGRWRHGIPSLA